MALLPLLLLLAATARSCDVHVPDLDPLAFPAAPLLDGVFTEKDDPYNGAPMYQHQSRPLLLLVREGNHFQFVDFSNNDRDNVPLRSVDGTGSELLGVEEWEYVDPVNGAWRPVPGGLRIKCAPTDMHQCASQTFAWTTDAEGSYRPVGRHNHRPVYRSGKQHLKYKDGYWRVSGGDVKLRARSSALSPAGLGAAEWEERTRSGWHTVERRLVCVTPPSDNCTKCENNANCFYSEEACLCWRGYAGPFCARAQEHCPPLPAEVYLPLGSPAVEGDLAFTFCEDGSFTVRSCGGGRWTSERCPGETEVPTAAKAPETTTAPKVPKNPTIAQDRNRPDLGQLDLMKLNASAVKPGSDEESAETMYVVMVAVVTAVVVAVAAALLFALGTFIWKRMRRTAQRRRRQKEKEEEEFELKET